MGTPPAGSPPPTGTVTVSPVSLPSNIPATWLDEIKDAVKSDRPSMVGMLLGSSLVSALIAAGTAFGTAYFTIKANGDLEMKKADLATRQAELKDTLSAYDQLDQRLSQLLMQLKGVAQLIQISQSYHTTPGNLKAELQGLGVSEGTILAMKADSHISPRAWQAVDKPLGELASAINQANLKADNFPSAETMIETDLNNAIEEVRKEKTDLKTEYFR